MDKKKIQSEALRFLIKSKGLTQKELAIALNVAERTVNDALYRGNMRETTVRRYLDAMGATWNEYIQVLQSFSNSQAQEPTGTYHQPTQLDRIEAKLNELLSLIKDQN